ncbi:MAG: short chain dehydrogenase [Chitinophagales bacterium]|nr:MAG: short chain dehydrogenase [Chitinophagales bacterium]
MYRLTKQFLSRRAFITGAASGLGKALSLQLAQDGWIIGVSDIAEEGLMETSRLIAQYGGRAIPFVLDVADRLRYEEVARQFLEQTGGIDLLINNAGVGDGGLFEEYGLDNWEWIVRVNQMSVIYGCHFFIPVMKRQKSGHIINISSIASMTSAPLMGGYNATKAAVKAISETLYAELRPFGIGVSVVMPYFFRTNIIQYARGSYGTSDLAYYIVHSSKVSAEEVAIKILKRAGKKTFYILHPWQAWLFYLWKRFFPLSLLHFNIFMARHKDTLLKRYRDKYFKQTGKKKGETVQ